MSQDAASLRSGRRLLGGRLGHAWFGQAGDRAQHDLAEGIADAVEGDVVEVGVDETGALETFGLGDECVAIEVGDERFDLGRTGGALATSALALISSTLGNAAKTSAGMSISFVSLFRQFMRSFSARSSSLSFEKRDLAFRLRSFSAA